MILRYTNKAINITKGGKWVNEVIFEVSLDTDTCYDVSKSVKIEKRKGRCCSKKCGDTNTRSRQTRKLYVSVRGTGK